MAITLPETSSAIQAEYAAANVSFNRSVQPDSTGHLVPVVTAQIAYSRTDYVVNDDGDKLNIVQRNLVPGPGLHAGDPYQGYLSLDAEQTIALKAAGNMDNAVDALVQADLVKRGLL